MPLHPFIRTILDQMADRPRLSDGTPDDARNLVAAGRDALGKGPMMAVVRDITIQASKGHTVKARYMSPKVEPDGLIIFIHGGGWVLGSLDDYDTYARSLAAETGYGVLLPDYRLAPENPFPAGLEDCEAVLAACITGKIDGIEINRPLIIAGDSAGANLATVVARRSSERHMIAAQILYYPVTDCDFANTSYVKHANGLTLTVGDMAWFFNHYAPQEIWKFPDISPNFSDDLNGMAPAIIVTAEYDVLCDEGEFYARKLGYAGVPVTLRRADGLTHGFIRLHNLLDESDHELKLVSAEIRAFGHKWKIAQKG